jgi:phosphate:Na+ symporter
MPHSFKYAMTPKLWLISGLLFLFWIPLSFAQPDPNAETMDWFKMGLWLMGGLAMFLYGMERMIEGLLAVSGDRLKAVLSKLTTNRIAGAATGTLVTATIQSSSVTTVLVVGFISAGLLTLTQGITIIMGANLGTTITAQIIAFKLTNLAMLMIAAGFLIQFVARTKRTHNIGTLILGFGLLFFGMEVMSLGMAPLRQYEPFIELMRELDNPLLGILIGFAFTALVQSSSATIGIVIVLAANGFISLPAGIALVFGADIGTCVTALLAAIGKTRDAVRAALAHVFFNVIGVLIWLPFIPILGEVAMWLSMTDVQAAGLAMQDTSREIANANTFFKFTVLLMFLPLLGFLVWLVYRLVPVSQEELSQAQNKPKFLDPVQLQTPSLALEAVNKEIERLGHMTILYYRHANQAVLNGDVEKMTKLELERKRLVELHTAVLTYLGELTSHSLSESENAKLVRLMGGLDAYESMVDVIHTGIMQTGYDMIDDKIKPSATMKALFESLAGELEMAIEKSFQACYQPDSGYFVEIQANKNKVDRLIQDALEHQARSLNNTPRRIQIFRLEMQLADAFKRLHTLAKRAARIAEEAQQEKTDRAPLNLVS